MRWAMERKIVEDKYSFRLSAELGGTNDRLLILWLICIMAENQQNLAPLPLYILDQIYSEKWII